MYNLQISIYFKNHFSRVQHAMPQAGLQIQTDLGLNP